MTEPNDEKPIVEARLHASAAADHKKSVTEELNHSIKDTAHYATKPGCLGALFPHTVVTGRRIELKGHHRRNSTETSLRFRFAIAGAVLIPLSVLSLYFHFRSTGSHVTPPPLPDPPSTQQSDEVYVTSVDFSHHMHRDKFLGMTTRTDYFDGFTIRIINNTGIPMDSANALYQFGYDEHAAGGGSLFLQSWQSYTSTTPLRIFFPLPKEHLSTFEFISWPNDESYPRPKWLRVRVQNRDEFITKWFDVDLSTARWDGPE